MDLWQSFTTPSVFDNTNDNRVVDEYTFGLYQNKDVGYNALKKHWETFITEQDFADIAAAGCVTRISVLRLTLTVLFWADSTMSGSPSDTGYSMLPPTSLISLDSCLTSSRLLTGQRNTA